MFTEIEIRLGALVKATGQTKAYYVKTILEHLNTLEDIYIAEKRLEDIRAGKSHTIPLEDVMKRYGIEGKGKVGIKGRKIIIHFDDIVCDIVEMPQKIEDRWKIK